MDIIGLTAIPEGDPPEQSEDDAIVDAMIELMERAKAAGWTREEFKDVAYEQSVLLGGWPRESRG
jgi:ribosomal protein S12 methylthiotransferase accessory factor YcaO